MGKYSSIFNDVIGPVMTGPSSSHTAGCARIGRMTRLLYGGEIKKAEIIFDMNSSYISTYIGQGSNYGFVGGLLGFSPEDIRLKDAIRFAEDRDIEVTFSKADLRAGHPNEARINILNDKDEVEMTVLTRSTGGGMFEIIEMDGFPVRIKGEEKILFIAAEAGAVKEVEALLGSNSYEVEVKRERILYSVSNPMGFEGECIEKIKKVHGISFVRTAEVLLPVAVKKDAAPPFVNAGRALAYSVEKKSSLWELAIEYECSVGDITPEGVMEKMFGILDAMRRSAQVHYPDDVPKTGFLGPQAYAMQQKMKKRKLADAGLLNKSMLWAVAVMENNAAHNVVVAAPTAGSCGVIPASVVALGEEMGLCDDDIVKALLASGLVGAFIANQATFGAEVAACQAENGAASAMAAAGVVQLMGGTVEEGFAAASVALQNLLGLICDPVGGLTEIPCINRNVAAAANAVMSANMALCGYDAFIPLDETIQTMMEVGKMLPRELRCTCEGGLCACPTGKSVDEALKKQRQSL